MPPMSWAKKLFGLILKCGNCGEKLRHDILWSVITVLAFTSIAYFLTGFFAVQWVVGPILFFASLVIIVTPLKSKTK